MRTDILDRKDEILQWISENKSKAFICAQLHCKPSTLNSYLQKMNIEYQGQQGWSKGLQLNNGYISAEEYSKKEYAKSTVLREKLIRDGIKEKKCEICGISHWQGIELPLELHHKDGNHFNNNLNNLQILCPNCHSIQSGHSGANSNQKQNKCIDCGKIISSKAIRCSACFHKSRQIEKYNEEMHIMKDTGNIVNREELKQLIRTTPFVQIGKQFNVSDNAIRKWCKRFGLPSKVSDIKQYSDEEWEKL